MSFLPHALETSLAFRYCRHTCLFSGLPSLSSVFSMKATEHVAPCVPALFVTAQTCTSLPVQYRQAATRAPMSHQKDYGLPTSMALWGSHNQDLLPPPSPKIQPCAPASSTRISALCNIGHACPSIHFRLFILEKYSCFAHTSVFDTRKTIIICNWD